MSLHCTDTFEQPFADGFEPLPAYPASPANTEDMLDKEYTRRRFGQLVGLVGAALRFGTVLEAGLLADTAYAELFNTGAPSLHEIDTTNERNLRTSTFFIPGFNVRESRPSAEVYRRTLPNVGGLVAANYGDEGFNLDRFSSMIFDYANKRGLENVIFVGHSLGGAIAIALAVKAQEAGLKVPLIVADSSPGASADVKDWSGLIESGVPGVLSETNQSGGYMTRTGIELAQRLNQDFDRFLVELRAGAPPARALRKNIIETIGQNASEAWRQATEEGLVNKVCLDQLQFLAENPLSKYGHKLGPETALQYICTANPPQDPTVEVIGAQNGYARVLDQPGRNFAIYKDPILTHADPERFPDIYNRLVGHFISRINLPDLRRLQPN